MGPRSKIVSSRNRMAEEEDGNTQLVCDKRDRAITCVFCRDRHLPPMFSGPLQKTVQRKVKFGEKLFQTNLLSRLSHKVAVFLSRPVA